MIYKSVPAFPNVKFSAIGFGTWSLGEASGWNGSSDEQSIATVRQAVECGINFFDTAPVYGLGCVETVLGKGLKGLRDEVFVASKCGLVWDENKNVRNDLSAKAVINDVDASLKRMQIDHLDLLQLHWPDPNTSLEETAKGLATLVEGGKILSVGVTNFSIADTVALSKLIPVSSYQGLYNLFERNPDSYHNIPLAYRTESEVLPYTLKNGMAFFPYSPLFQGILTGKFKVSGEFDENDVRAANPKLNGDNLVKYLSVAEEMKAIADQAGMSLLQLSLAWLTSNDAVTSILCGAQSPKQIIENAQTAEVSLTSDLMRKIEGTLVKHGL